MGFSDMPYDIYPHTPYFVNAQLSIAKRPGIPLIYFMHKFGHIHAPVGKRAMQIRLRKIAGQIRAIETMIGADVDCPEVLMQLVSVRRALKSLAETIIETHLHDCIEGATRPSEARRRLRELLTVLERYVE